VSGGREQGRRARDASHLAVLVALVLTACAGPIAPPPTVATPETSAPSGSAGESAGNPFASPTPLPAPTPTPRPRAYRIRSGENLITIAKRFGLSVAQLLHANPSISDPDSIRAGAVIVIPPRTASTGLPLSASMADPANDLVDQSGFATFGQSYADILHFEAAVGSRDLVMEILLINGPPPTDPSFETVTYTINVDTDGDGQPDYSVIYSNALAGQVGYAASLKDQKVGVELAGPSFPGVARVLSKTIQLTVPRVALGDPAQYALAAVAERAFLPGGPGDSETEGSIDLDPNQQWPHPNARWLEIGL
jgi:LysM repeat protein